MSRLMTLFLLLTAIMGILLPQYIDNWGHAGGTIVGAPMGLADRRLIANRWRPSAWGMGVVAALIMAGGGAAQFWEDRRETPALMERSLIARSDRTTLVEGHLNAIGRLALGRGDPKRILDVMESYEPALNGPGRGEIRWLRLSLIEALHIRTLSESEQAALRKRIPDVLRRLVPVEEWLHAIQRYLPDAVRFLLMLDERVLDDPARQEFVEARRLIEVALDHPLSETERQELANRLTRTIREIRRQHRRDQDALRELRRHRQGRSNRG